MAAKLRPLHWKDVATVLRRLGYTHHRTKGSHAIYVKSGQAMHVTLVQKKEIPVGTLKNIIRQIGIETEAFMALLNQ